MALSALSARRAHSAHVVLLACCALIAAGCDGEVVNLGNSERLQAGGDGGSAGTMASGGTAQGGARMWSEPQLVLALEGSVVANATFDATMMQLFYSVQPQGADMLTTIYRADGPDFQNGKAVTFAGSSQTGSMKADEASPAVSADGKQLWLGMLGPSGNTDIYVSTGEKDSWSMPEAVPELSSNLGDDVPRPPAFDETIMPLSSKRGSKLNLYQIYFSTRKDVKSPWGEPTQEYLDAINAPSFQSADGLLTEDALQLYFASNRGADGHHDLYVAARSSADVPFGEPQALVDLRTTCVARTDKYCEERMPWLSPNGDRLYFTSNRTGEYALYVSERLAP
jgi:hypothetical protein